MVIERNEAIAGDEMEHQMAAFTGKELECKIANVANSAICAVDKKQPRCGKKYGLFCGMERMSHFCCVVLKLVNERRHNVVEG